LRRPADDRAVSDTPTRFDREAPRGRTNRHRPQIDPAPAPAPAPARAPAPPTAPARPAPRRSAPVPSVHDRTDSALRRPAHISDRCTGCGAPTLGRSRMVTELVESGPVRALRVVACSACPDRRRRDVIV
jgi:hypothetical protein